MNRCNEIREELEPFVLRVLDAERAALVEQHVEECAPCRATIRETESVVRQLDLLPRVHAVRPAFLHQVMSATVDRRPRAHFWGRGLRYGTAAAAGALLAIFVLRFVPVRQAQPLVTVSERVVGVESPESRQDRARTEIELRFLHSQLQASTVQIRQFHHRLERAHEELGRMDNEKRTLTLASTDLGAKVRALESRIAEDVRALAQLRRSNERLEEKIAAYRTRFETVFVSTSVRDTDPEPSTSRNQIADLLPNPRTLLAPRR